MTENEAKTKWCPEVRTGLVSGMVVNRHVAKGPYSRDDVYDETRCIGSLCMAWRWIIPSHDVVLEARAIGFEPMLKNRGYCGKAGKP